MAGRRGGALADDAGLTVIELLDAFAMHVESYYVQDGQQTSEVTSIKLAMRPLKRLYGSLTASEFRPLKLQAVRDEFVRDCAYCPTNGPVRRVGEDGGRMT